MLKSLTYILSALEGICLLALIQFLLRPLGFESKTSIFKRVKLNPGTLVAQLVSRFNLKSLICRGFEFES